MMMIPNEESPPVQCMLCVPHAPTAQSPPPPPVWTSSMANRNAASCRFANVTGGFFFGWFEKIQSWRSLHEHRMRTAVALLLHSAAHGMHD